MNKFLKYNIEFDTLEENKNYGKFTIKPLEKGFGNTLGNSLRRALIGNMVGASLFAIKIPGVSHEFQAIKGVKEDVTEIILNLKKLVIKFDDEVMSLDDLEHTKLEKWPVMTIKSTGGIITAKDINCPPEFKIINTDLYICKVNENTKFQMDLYATVGRGFKTFEENKEMINSIGIIAIDSNFSPIIRASYWVDEIKTSKRDTNDALTLEVVTNSAISPSDALSLASKILIEHYNPLLEINKKISNMKLMKDDFDQPNNNTLSIPIEELDLSVRSYNCLKRAGIQTIHQITNMTRLEIEKIRNLGKKSLKEIIKKIEERNLKFKDER
ncbi:MAG: DNA-directed RNA polymerase subunit alpha [Mycoplasmoidaceae bacterium]